MEKAIYPKSTCCFPGCTRWSRTFAPGSEWLCGPKGCWRKLAPQSRRLLRRMWKRMRQLWPAGPEWADLPRKTQLDYDRLWTLERRLWRRAIKRAVEQELGLA